MKGFVIEVASLTNYQMLRDRLDSNPQLLGAAAKHAAALQPAPKRRAYWFASSAISTPHTPIRALKRSPLAWLMSRFAGRPKTQGSASLFTPKQTATPILSALADVELSGSAQDTGVPFSVYINTNCNSDRFCLSRCRASQVGPGHRGDVLNPHYNLLQFRIPVV